MKGIKSIMIGLGAAGWLREPWFDGDDIERIVVALCIAMYVYAFFKIREAERKRAPRR